MAMTEEESLPGERESLQEQRPPSPPRPGMSSSSTSVLHLRAPPVRLSVCPSVGIMSVAFRPSVWSSSLEVTVFEVPVLEGEALLLPLAPFLVVKVNVSSLKKQEKKKKKQTKKKPHVAH